MKLRRLLGKGPNRARRTTSQSRAVDGRGLRAGKLLAGLQVKANKGNPGIAGMKVGELSGLSRSNKREVGSRSLRVVSL